MRKHLRPDPPDYSLLIGSRQELARELSSASRAADFPSVSGNLQSSGVLSPDLVLDLALHEIAAKVCSETKANGTAIALTRAGELVCRATTGSAPDLGVRLDPHSGLSGKCLQTAIMQRCDDTETDSRVDMDACRSLNIRSILVAPIVSRESVLGLIEVFSSKPSHFMDSDREVLQTFSSQVAAHLQPAVEVNQGAPGLGAVATPGRDEIQDGDPKSVAPENLASDAKSATKRWAWPLLISAVALAMFLGWMLGKNGEHQLSPLRSAFPDVHAQSKPTAKDASPAEEKAPPPDISNGGLVVYKNGKIIFRESSRHAPAAQRVDAKQANSPSSGSVVPAGRTEILPPEAADNYVLHKVTPEYPESAKNQRKEGSVLLKVLVGKDGGVEQVQILSGDPLLAATASDALIRWQFRPLLSRGKPVEFKTQVTVNFKLPR